MNWVIGDIHGMLRPLTALVDRVRAADPSSMLNFVGDYVNRGAQSAGVVNLLISLDNARFCRGNHDDIFDLLINRESYVPNPSAPSEVEAFTWFVQHGLWETLSSYGVEPNFIDYVLAQPSPGAIARLMSVIPETHREFFRTLPPIIEDETFFVGHAMWNIDEPDQEPSISQRLETSERLRYQILWGRYGRELTRPKAWRRTGYFGHTPVQTYPVNMQMAPNIPIVGPNIVLLDTAAALSYDGRLTAVCVEDASMIQVDRLGEEVE